MAASKLTIDVTSAELPLAERFTIARKSWDSTTNVFAHASFDGATGSGEACPDDRRGESVDSVVAVLNNISLERLRSPYDLEGVLDLLPPGAARCALDVALHDLAARRAGLPLSDFLGLGSRPLPPTSVTVPIAPLEQMVARAHSLSNHPVLKLKVGFEGDVKAVATIRAVYDGAIRVDANEGWEPSEAVDKLERINHFGIELCEQPIAAGRHAELRAVSEASPIPVFADEDVFTAQDVATLAGIVSGVNLKLGKTGGIREFLRAVSTARACELKVMIGCDLESGINATAGASVASLVDFADLDSPLLLANDPHPGVAYDNGAMTLPSGEGLGIRR